MEELSSLKNFSSALQDIGISVNLEIQSEEELVKTLESFLLNEDQLVWHFVVTISKLRNLKSRLLDVIEDKHYATYPGVIYFLCKVKELVAPNDVSQDKIDRIITNHTEYILSKINSGEDLNKLYPQFVKLLTDLPVETLFCGDIINCMLVIMNSSITNSLKKVVLEYLKENWSELSDADIPVEKMCFELFNFVDKLMATGEMQLEEYCGRTTDLILLSQAYTLLNIVFENSCHSKPDQILIARWNTFHNNLAESFGKDGVEESIVFLCQGEDDLLLQISLCHLKMTNLKLNAKLVSPFRMFRQILSESTFDSTVLVDWLTGPETCVLALEYFLRVVKLLTTQWTDFVAAVGDADEILSPLIRVRMSLERHRDSGMLQFDPGPLNRVLLELEDLYEKSGTSDG